MMWWAYLDEVEVYLDIFPQLFGFNIPLHNLIGDLSVTEHQLLSPSTTKGCQEFQDEMLFVEFVLQIGLLLETMIVT
ncbi:hypothetical protein TSUD_94410 [Trifolium subterraneum]|uniref:Uncharacterized protein n=1 Tax=Trifolium subterraneum TaxID=3900 RepID=A0A2Z6NVF9_TRISU|nr:hypothetical protein TSUD_94410 [Trifolium subterraneum]